MQRTGFLFGQVLERANLELAFRKAARGKGNSPVVTRFRSSLGPELDQIRRRLASGEFRFGLSHQFKIYDPKERIISAPRFSERLVHHAIMNICEPLLDRRLIDDSFACRRGKGRTRAVQRACHFANTFPWVAKLDIRKYFDSIDHPVLLTGLECLFKDPELLALFHQIIESHSVSPRKGLPIGALTSQHFANYYLAPMDRWVKEDLRRRGYVRYMDDFLIFGLSEEELWALIPLVSQFLATRLKLVLKPNPGVFNIERGVDFLGYRIQSRRNTTPALQEGAFRPKRATIYLSRRSQLRFRRKLKALAIGWDRGDINDLEFQRRSQALVEFTRCASAANYRRCVMGEMECDAIGLEPRHPGRQLERLSRQLPVREPECEPSRQSEREPGLSSGLGPSSPVDPEDRTAEPACAPADRSKRPAN